MSDITAKSVRIDLLDEQAELDAMVAGLTDEQWQTPTASERWSVAEGVDVTVVFERPMSPPIESATVTVAHAPVPGRNSADDEIVRLIAADSHPEQIRVATSDRTLAERVRSSNASVWPAERFRELIDPR